MAFDPSIYSAPNCEADATVSDAVWIERFVAHLIKEGSPVADDEFRADLPSYARKVAPDYLKTRGEYIDPEEAAETDISYWENEE
jgi:hypothetical protein